MCLIVLDTTRYSTIQITLVLSRGTLQGADLVAGFITFS